MVKRKKSGPSKTSSNNIFDNVEDVDSDAEEFFHDEVDLFHLDREKNNEKKEEEDYDELEDDQEEVLGIEDDDDEFEDDEDVREVEDVGGVEDEDLSDLSDDNEDEPEEGWGKRKSTFYGAESLEGLQGHDRDAVMDAEEEEASRIQKRLLEEVDEEQFDIFAKIPKLVEMSEGKTTTQQKEKIETDISLLSEDTRWEMIEQDSPELPQLIDDFKTKSEELQTKLYPLLKLVDKDFIKGPGAVYVKTKLNATLMYLINISFYMSLKTQKISVENHPVISRLVQYRTVLNKLKKVDKKLNSEIEEVLKMEVGGSFFDSPVEEDGKETNKPKLLELPPLPNPVDYFAALQERLKKRTVEQTQLEEGLQDTNEIVEETDERRAINYKMSKNKGITSKRRKMDRNPRVKHREKFRKAKIRRRGQVREYKPEMNKYSGEMSGIRAGVIRGVRLK